MLNLFDYQNDSISSLRDGFKSGHKKQIFYLPTGGGKTECAIELLKKCKDKGTRCAMVMDRRVLVYQTSARLKKYGIDHGIIMDGEPYQGDELIQVCSEQTLARRGGLGELELIVLDEAHVFRKATIELLKTKPKINVVGLTATPFTKGLGNIYSNVVSKITTKQLVDKKRLINPRYFMLTAINTEGVKKIAGEYDEGELQERAVLISGDIVKEWTEKTFQFFGKPEKTIVFSSGVNHSVQLAEKFNDAGFKFVAISYLDKEEYKNNVINEFNSKDSSIIGLISTDILTKGFDSPEVKIGVSARPFSKSFSSHVQQLGRVMRVCDGKDDAIWLDHSGNLETFRGEWIDLYYNGVNSLDCQEDEKKGKKPFKKCPSCAAEIPLACKECPECGHEFEPRPKEIEVISGNLEEVDILKQDEITKDDKIFKHKVTSFVIIPHRSKAGNDGFKAIINTRYTKYFAVHTKKGMEEYLKASKSVPTDIVIKKSGQYPDIYLEWK